MKILKPAAGRIVVLTTTHIMPEAVPEIASSTPLFENAQILLHPTVLHGHTLQTELLTTDALPTPSAQSRQCSSQPVTPSTH
jgi:hypothetical protein